MAGRLINLSDFLAQIDLLHLEDRFVAEDIDMSVLPLLDKDDLKELGLNLGQRKKLIQALQELGLPGRESAAAQDAPQDHPVQLRRLSVMFCDMVGSTELGERLAIDEMQSVLTHYYDIAKSVAQRYNGHLAGSQGDGLVMLFGYPRVLEGFAERCILAAQDLQRTLFESPAIIEGREPIDIATRVGIASGQAAVGFNDGDVLGDHIHLVGPVVNRAARLQSVAHPQSIAVDFRTRELTSKSVLYGPGEEHVLKGLAGKIEVFHVLGMRDRHETSATPVTLIGRDAEISELYSLWAQAQRGRAVTATISGTAGIGKSTLVQSFLARGIAPSTRVLNLRCMAMAAQSPLRPVANALTALTKEGDAPRSLASVLNHPAPEMTQRAAQFLEIAGAPNSNPKLSAVDRSDILDLLADWIINGAGGRSVLVLEDAQWADDSTRELMVRAAQRARTEGSKLLMLAITRDDSANIWPDQSGPATMSLSPLDPAHSDAVLGRIVGDAPLPHSVRQNILYHADGNPLMLEALGQAQAQQELPELADAVLVPHTIYEAVSKRLDSIGSGRSVIEALAVLGTSASRDLLRKVSEHDTRDIGQAIEALEQAGLIARGTGFDQDEISIRHKVYRDVIYEQIAGQSRKRLHLAAYHVLREKDGVRAEVLATHAQAAQDWKNAAAHALNAGQALLTRSALIEAGHFLEMADAALKRLPASLAVSQSRLRAITGLASVERSRFGIATDKSAYFGQQAVQLAREIGDKKTELLALNGLYSHALVHADYPQAEEYAQALLKAAKESRDETFEMIGTRATGAVALHRGDHQTAVRALSRALDQYDKDAHLPLAHLHGYDHAEICAALLSMSLWISGDLRLSRHYSAFSIDHSREIDHAHSLAQAISFRVMLGAFARHGSELNAVAEEAIKVAEKYDIRVMRAAARLFPFATQLCLQSGPPSKADMTKLAHLVEEFRAVNPFNYGPLLASVLAEIYLRADDISAADEVLSQAKRTEANTGETWTSSELLRMDARVAAARDDHAAAARLRAEAMERAHCTGAATIALRIACDMMEADRCPEATRALRDALDRIVSNDEGWDMKRAEALLQTGSDA